MKSIDAFNYIPTKISSFFHKFVKSLYWQRLLTGLTYIFYILVIAAAFFLFVGVIIKIGGPAAPLIIWLSGFALFMLHKYAKGEL